MRSIQQFHPKINLACILFHFNIFLVWVLDDLYGLVASDFIKGLAVTDVEFSQLIFSARQRRKFWQVCQVELGQLVAIAVQINKFWHF